MKALLIVLPSALDDFGAKYGVNAERDLAQAIFAAMEEFDGPVYVLDQTGPLQRQSTILKAFGRALRLMSIRKDLRSIVFPKDVSWPEVMRKTWKRLADDGVKKLVLGGIWFDPDLEIGPTTEIYNDFSRAMDVEVDVRIIGRTPTSSEAQ